MHIVPARRRLSHQHADNQSSSIHAQHLMGGACRPCKVDKRAPRAPRVRHAGEPCARYGGTGGRPGRPRPRVRRAAAAERGHRCGT
eukprot:scaffold689_cov375-Prasinococcus_capsulatus_cf.AAC.14